MLIKQHLPMRPVVTQISSWELLMGSDSHAFSYASPNCIPCIYLLLPFTLSVIAKSHALMYITSKSSQPIKKYSLVPFFLC